jgi:hypothetical protein
MSTSNPLSVPPVAVESSRSAFRSMSERERAFVRSRLSDVAGVDGAYIQESSEVDEGGIIVDVLAREHGIVARERLLEIEDELAEMFGVSVMLVVRAHQGRDMRSLAGPSLLFVRG